MISNVRPRVGKESQREKSIGACNHWRARMAWLWRVQSHECSADNRLYCQHPAIISHASPGDSLFAVLLRRTDTLFADALMRRGNLLHPALPQHQDGRQQ
nr:putative integron gene cassette protein [uncultured bacterium]